MRLWLNDTEIQLPTTHREVTLGQRIEYERQHGKALEAQLQEIASIEDELDRDIALADYNLQKMFSVFAFFAGCTVEAVATSEHVNLVHSIYSAVLKRLVEDPEIGPASAFEWNGKIWHLPPPELQHGSNMTFGEFIDAKQLIKDHIEAGSNRLEYLPQICAIFLRKAGERYTENFLYSGSERLQLMHSLPIDIALQVAFFLRSSMSLSRGIFRYLDLRARKEVAGIQKNITNVGAGSISLSQLHRPKFLMRPAKIASTASETRLALMY